MRIVRVCEQFPPAPGGLAPAAVDHAGGGDSDQGHQQAQDGDNDHQLDEREAPPGSRSPAGGVAVGRVGPCGDPRPTD